jgi:hypothetical protein
MLPPTESRPAEKQLDRPRAASEVVGTSLVQTQAAHANDHLTAHTPRIHWSGRVSLSQSVTPNGAAAGFEGFS